MKIRSGFVSNSSSSSFLIYGMVIEADEAKSALLTEELYKEATDDPDWAFADSETFEDMSAYDISECISSIYKKEFKKGNLSIETGPEAEYLYIGVTHHSFPDYKTVGEIKKNIKDTLNMLFKTDSIKTDWHSECWRDG